jgi:hypothetical protein
VGIAIAFFVAGPAMLAGLSEANFTTVAIVVCVIWTALIVWTGVLTIRYAMDGDADAARGRAGTALAIIMVPAALWLSAGTLKEM